MEVGGRVEEGKERERVTRMWKEESGKKHIRGMWPAKYRPFQKQHIVPPRMGCITYRWFTCLD